MLKENFVVEIKSEDIQLSAEAKWLMKAIKDPDINDIKRWFLRNHLVIGSTNIMEYLKEKYDKKG